MYKSYTKVKNKNYSIILVIVLFVLLIRALYTFTTRNNHDFSSMQKAYVNYVVDGDTIEVTYEGKRERIRLIGIDTPESVNKDSSKNVPFGSIASAFTKEMLEGKDVYLEFDTQKYDKYGRSLSYVYLGETMFNKTLVEMGYAKSYNSGKLNKYSLDFIYLEMMARKYKRGLWAQP